jgi:hypothetical protein
MSDNTQMVTFPRELSDELAELIAEKARVCGAGAFDIWEAICEQFGRSALSAETDEHVAFESWHKSVVEGDPSHEKYNSGDYRNQHVQRYWLGWQARSELSGVKP